MLVISLSTLLVSHDSIAELNEDQVLIESKLRMLDYILQGSASVKKIQASENDEAKLELERAFQARQQAHQLLKKQRYKPAEKFADQALKIISIANRLLAKQNSQELKEESRYHILNKTIDSFLGTFSQELSTNTSGKTNKKTLDKDLFNAAELASKKQFSQANQILEKSYQNLKEYIYQQRDKQTLVYSLDFASDKEEYEYEQKRYKSYQLLLDMAKKKNTNISEKSNQLVKQFVDKSQQLNQQAKQLAKKEKHRDAIEKLEESAKYLSRALRTMGLMIP